MTSSTVVDESLYQIALEAEPSPPPLLLSANTLNSLVGALAEVLIQQRLAATVWVKLPQGDVWQAEIKRYQEQVPANIICLSTNDKEAETSVHHAPAAARTIAVRLPAESQLRREYFLIVAAPQFCGLILAHRPRRAKVAGEASPERHPLLAIASFERQIVGRALQGIKRAFAGAEMSQLLSELNLPATEWDALFSLPAASDLGDRSPQLLSLLLTKQIQRQEEIWRGGAAERKLAATAAALQQQAETLLNDLRFKDDFLSHVAQELRTPLTNMKTALTLLESAHLKPAQRQRYMQVLQTECDRQSSLITSLLSLVQLDREPQATENSAINLADIVPGVVSTYQPLAQEKGIQLAYTIPANLPAIACPETWLKQIVINLLHNSIKFTARGGQVWVKAKQQGEYLQLEFRDTGIGIAESDLPKIFDRFYRGRAAGDDQAGAGLGLTIVQQLLLRCGGSISVTSKPNEGSTFKVLLPIKS